MKLKLALVLKEYEQKTIFSNAHFLFESGKIYAIMGASGSGKTTLLNILAGQDTDYKGRLSYENQTISKKAKVHDYVFQHVAYYPQFPAFFENIDGESNILISYFDQHPSPSLLAKMQLKKGQITSHLSGGERKKLSLLHHAVQQKTILLFDEPTNGLDDQTKHKVMKYICHHPHAIVLFTTHDQEIASFYADVIYYL